MNNVLIYTRIGTLLNECIINNVYNTLYANKVKSPLTIAKL